MADYELGGVVRSRTGSVLTGVAPSNVYPTADGSDIVIAANADSVFVRLCAAMGEPDLATDERYATHGARGTNMAELDERIAAWTKSHPVKELLAILDAKGVPAGQIFTAREMVSDPHYLARDMVLRMQTAQGWNVPMTGVVPKFSRTPGSVRRPGPGLGDDTEAVLREIGGLTAAEVGELRDAGLL